MAYAQNSVEPYEGTEKEEFSQFEQLFQGCVRIAGIDAGQQANCFQRNLQNNALRFYQTLGPATREKVCFPFQSEPKNKKSHRVSPPNHRNYLNHHQTKQFSIIRYQSLGKTSAKGTILTYTKKRFSSGLQLRDMVDTGDCANVIPKKPFEDLKNCYFVLLK